MTNTILISKAFKRDAKKLVKKFTTLKGSIDQLIAELIENPYIGTPYGADLYKVRLSDQSKGAGKRGGFRVLYFHLRKSDLGFEIMLITIYDKSEKSTILKADALKKLKQIISEEG